MLLLVALSLWSTTPTVLARQGYVRSLDAKLFYQTAGSGTPVIFLHGGPGLDSSYLLPQMKKLAKKYQVVFYDQRGSGKSLPIKLITGFYTLNQFVADLERLRQTLRFNQIILVGHSWGGILAIAYAIKYPSHLRGLVLMNSIPSTSEGFKAYSEEIEKRILPVLNSIDATVKSPAFIRGDVQAFKRYCELVFKPTLYNIKDISKISLNFSATTAKNQIKIEKIFSRQLLEKEYDFRPQLKELHTPTLVIHGDVDPIPLWTAQQTADSIPHAKLLVIKNSGHFSYAEKEREVFLALDSFITNN